MPQNYKKYSHEDQALWRFVMRGIKHNLSLYGLKGGLKGLEQTGISQDKIPKISDIDRNLRKFGWRAVCISGFIPPRAFMEFQKSKILPIASELRSVQHVFYTPAPDIIHEAVGHVPFLTNPLFSKFLEKYAQTVLKAIFSREDMEKYKAIRDLSDLKENPHSSPQQIQRQEQKLKAITKNMSHVSESARLSRLIWWTSEYGLIGSLKNPKIYGAGLISSIGESLQIQKVKKIKLSENCLNYPFDITDFQPQLFVAESFKQAGQVLEKISKKMAVKRGGAYGVREALKSQTVNTVVLNSGLQISGILTQAIITKNNKVAFLKFSGPVQLSFQGRELKGHGKAYHKEGYSTALNFQGPNSTPYFWTKSTLSRQGLQIGKKSNLQFAGGIRLTGELKSCLRRKGRWLLLSFKNCLIKDEKNKLLYHPSWGPFDLAVGPSVSSVFSGPADNKAYGLKDDFEPSKIPQKFVSKKQIENFKIYKQLNHIKNLSEKELEQLIHKLKTKDHCWLMFLELLHAVRQQARLKKKLLASLGPVAQTQLQGKKVFQLGKKFYKIREKNRGF